MTLTPQSPSNHNRMLGRRIKHPKSTNFDDTADGSSPRPSKRQKTLDFKGPTLHGSTIQQPATPQSETEDGSFEDPIEETRRQTDLESALPPIKADEEAIEAYETYRAAQEEEKGPDSHLKERKWIPGRSSIYVDAFNLALDTVLEDESHLFDEAEQALFQRWRELEYEAQYLYVRLFLRKTSAWHRIEKLGYHSDVSDLNEAIAKLQTIVDLPESTAKSETNPGELEPPEGTSLGISFTFADRSEQDITTFDEASSLLLLDEVKLLAKDAKIIGKNKQELLTGLRRLSRQQTTLRRSDTGESIFSATHQDGTEQENDATPEDNASIMSGSHLFQRTMKTLGPCIRVSIAPLKLFERVLLVFYRSTDWTENSLTRIILAKIDRRIYPEYIVSRSANVFASRSLLLEFEASLRTQYRVDSILEFNGKPSAEKLQEILDLCDEIYPRWITLLQEEQEKEDSIYHSGEGAYLRRLSPAWVYTRIIHKAAYIYGKEKRHKREYEILSELLGQRLFHSSRRGAWYQRKALLEEHYMADLEPSENRNAEAQKKYWKRISLQTCEVGLQDPLVHVIYHHDLQKRIMKLEKALKVAKRAQHDFGHVRLAKPVEVTVKGTQVLKESNLQRPSTGRHASTPSSRKGGKTVWLDPLEDNAECSVEAMCLSDYRSRGYKGYHSEGGIIRTLFAYLFHDVLFTYVPNVFQTAYQTCPLDLHTDAFYPARLSEINHRLAALSNGGAESITRRIHNEHSKRRTCVIGLNWDFALEDLVEIVQCFDGGALATICKVMAQEYGQRGGGVPDLFCWHPEKKEVLFAEVKSENDSLSDTQRLWIDVLTGAGVRVELCNAVASEVKVVD